MEKCTELGLETLEARRRVQDKYMAGQGYSTTWEGRSRAETRQNAGGQGLTVQFTRTDPTK